MYVRNTVDVTEKLRIQKAVQNTTVGSEELVKSLPVITAVTGLCKMYSGIQAVYFM